MSEEFNLSEKRKKFKEDIDYLFGKIDWVHSNLDAKAITIMNEFWKDLIEADKEFIKLLKEEAKDNRTADMGRGEEGITLETLNLIVDKLAGEKLT